MPANRGETYFDRERRRPAVDESLRPVFKCIVQAKRAVWTELERSDKNGNHNDYF
ncbi:MAG: hypothetical protein HFI32_12145 [Lachnospiraceae bacterium]|nr:hypothetical protein [Lachnospiraceae bacterium]